MSKSNVSSRKKENTTPELLDAIRPEDICCGRGKGWINHPGNVKFQDIIQANHQIYTNNQTKNGKSRVVAKIVTEIQASGSRFVKKHKASGKWYVIGRTQAHEKTGHAIRDYILNQGKRRQPKKVIKKALKVAAFRNRNILPQTELSTILPQQELSAILPQKELSSSKTIQEEPFLPTTAVSGGINTSNKTEENYIATEKILSSDEDLSSDKVLSSDNDFLADDWPLPFIENEAICSNENITAWQRASFYSMMVMKEEQEHIESSQENKETSLSLDSCSDSQNVSIWNKTFNPSRPSIIMKEVLDACSLLPSDEIKGQHYEGGSNDFSIAIEGLWNNFELSN